VPTLAVGLVLQETASTVYDFATSDYQTPVASGSTLTVGDYALSPPTNLSVATDTTTVDVITNTSVTVTWSNASSPYIIGTEVLFKRNSDSVYSTMFANQGSTKQQITGLEVGVQYNFKARHLSAGSFSDFTSQENHTVVGTATAKADLTNSTVDYSSDGTGTMPANKGGTGITNFANSTHLNSNTTPANIGLSGGLVVPTVFRADNAPTALAAGDLWVDTNDGNKLYRSTGTGTGNWVEVSLTTSGIGLGNVQNKSSATILGETHTGNVTGTIGGVANSTITTGSSRAASVIDSNNRFTGDLTGNVRSNGTTKSMTEIIDAHDRATAGLDSSGNVQRAVPAAQINAALVTILSADSTIAQWISSDGSFYSPTSSTIDLTVTADNGTSKQSCTIRWTFVNVSNSTADYISACAEQADSSNAFTLGSITNLSGNDVKVATCVVTHTASSETITLSALISLTNVSGGGK